MDILRRSRKLLPIYSSDAPVRHHPQPPSLPSLVPPAAAGTAIWLPPPRNPFLRYALPTSRRFASAIPHRSLLDQAFSIIPRDAPRTARTTRPVALSLFGRIGTTLDGACTLQITRTCGCVPGVTVSGPFLLDTTHHSPSSSMCHQSLCRRDFCRPSQPMRVGRHPSSTCAFPVSRLHPDECLASSLPADECLASPLPPHACPPSSFPSYHAAARGLGQDSPLRRGTAMLALPARVLPCTLRRACSAAPAPPRTLRRALRRHLTLLALRLRYLVYLVRSVIVPNSDSTCTGIPPRPTTAVACSSF